MVTKPGYGIISECIANDTALLYTSRGDFREYPVLVKEMPKYLRCCVHRSRRFVLGELGAALWIDCWRSRENKRTQQMGLQIAAEIFTTVGALRSVGAKGSIVHNVHIVHSDVSL